MTSWRNLLRHLRIQNPCEPKIVAFDENGDDHVFGKWEAFSAKLATITRNRCLKKTSILPDAVTATRDLAMFG